MAISILKRVNQGGIPCLETIGNVLTDSGSTYNFNYHPVFNAYFQGIFIVKVSNTPTAPGTAVPVYFNTPGLNDSQVRVCDAAGAALTTSSFPGDGVYIFFYDRTTNILRLLTGIV